MKLIPFNQVRHKVQPGIALPWGVRNAAGGLLLAKGQIVTDVAMLQGLLQRGAFVDATEVERGNAADSELTGNLFNRWAGLEARLGGLLRSPAEKHFLQRVRESLVHVAAIANGNTDQLIYLILRHDHTRFNNYGVAHALHTAALCGLLSRRMGWPNSKCSSLIGAALTMNISILDLQGELATRGSRPTAAEQEIINDHCLVSARMLRDVGLGDEDWLQTIEQHHEIPGGGGYPRNITEPSEMAQLLRLVDVFTAKHSPRAGRQSLPAHQAARELFVQSKGNPMASLLIKELGIYPPGCYVKLASGEVGIVIEVGANAKTPVVATITNTSGDALLQPIRRDTAQSRYAVVDTVPDSAIKVKVLVENLYELGAQGA